jgi:hypothetical protein
MPDQLRSRDGRGRVMKAARRSAAEGARPTKVVPPSVREDQELALAIARGGWFRLEPNGAQAFWFRMAVFAEDRDLVEALARDAGRSVFRFRLPRAASEQWGVCFDPTRTVNLLGRAYRYFEGEERKVLAENVTELWGLNRALWRQKAGAARSLQAARDRACREIRISLQEIKRRFAYKWPAEALGWPRAA